MHAIEQEVILAQGEANTRLRHRAEAAESALHEAEEVAENNAKAASAMQARAEKAEAELAEWKAHADEACKALGLTVEAADHAKGVMAALELARRQAVERAEKAEAEWQAYDDAHNRANALEAEVEQLRLRLARCDAEFQRRAEWAAENHSDAEALGAQRDALAQALHAIATGSGMMHPHFDEAQQIARAALASLGKTEAQKPHECAYDSCCDGSPDA
jgi:DNA repair exonuclease SbcCD ATPase subunit